jgi:hypothetical protein
MSAYALAAMASLLTVYVIVSMTTTGSPSSFLSKASSSSSSHVRSSFRESTRRHPDLHMDGKPYGESYNAIALDIWETLDCSTLLNHTEQVVNGGGDEQQERRRLQEERGLVDDLVRPNEQEHLQQVNPDRNTNIQKDAGNLLQDGAVDQRDFGMDDFVLNEGEWNYGITPTAAHLFCMAAASEPVPKFWMDQVHCPVLASNNDNIDNGINQVQLDLLQLWSKARGDMVEDLLLMTLSKGQEHTRMLLNHTLHLWAPPSDDGLEYMLNVMNNEEGGMLRGLSHNLGRGKLFVDVGSCLGVTSMSIAILYPHTKIVSVEAASPNWLLQQLNWKCNAPAILTGPDIKADEPTILLGGVGAEMGGMAKLLWRPQATTSTRSWTPATERLKTDVELLVKLRPWHSLLAEAEVQHMSVDVLNVDCEGCEYNLIPSLSDEEYNAISTVLGAVHWGYMPEHKLPSSKRGAQTHERLCKHEGFAKTVKECCAFPDLEVVSTTPGEVLVQDSKLWPPKPSTVKDVAGSLCENFESWAVEHHLYDIESDWGWFQITPMAT